MVEKASGTKKKKTRPVETETTASETIKKIATKDLEHSPFKTTHIRNEQRSSRIHEE